MSGEVVKAEGNTGAALLERVVVGGDLSKLSAEERMTYYRDVCESVGLNPLTRPFEYITLNGKLTLYARKDCTDQLRAIHGVSVTDLLDEVRGDHLYIVTCKVRDAKGRVDAAKGAVSLAGLRGEAAANAVMKAETKAKRRATLSICGLGMLDETETETIPGAMFGETFVTSSTAVASGTSYDIGAPPLEDEPGPEANRPFLTGAITRHADEHKLTTEERLLIQKSFLKGKAIGAAPIEDVKKLYAFLADKEAVSNWRAERAKKGQGDLV